MRSYGQDNTVTSLTFCICLLLKKMHLTSVNVRRLAAVNMPIGGLTWEMKSQRYSDGAHGERGLGSLDIGCRPVVSLAAHLWPVWPGLSSTHLIIHSP